MEKDTNLVKSDINDQIETNNDQIETNNDQIKDNNDYVTIEVNKTWSKLCDKCKHNPKNTTKKEQFLNLIGINIGEEFYIEGEEKNSSHLIYHFTNDLHLLSRSSNDKEGILGWCTATSLGKLLDDDVKLIKIKN